jgi:hypothetical protein
MGGKYFDFGAEVHRVQQLGRQYQIGPATRHVLPDHELVIYLIDIVEKAQRHFEGS